MFNKYNKGFACSAQICSLYDEIIDMELGEFDFHKFSKIIDDIKQLKKLEDKSYNMLSFDEVEKYLINIDEKDIEEDKAIERYYFRLSERKKILTENDLYQEKYLISDVINSIILINSLDKLNKKIIYISNKESNNDNKYDIANSLLFFYYTSKYTFLSSSRFMEDLMLNYGFNLWELPKLDLLDALKEYDIDITIQTILTLKANEYMKKISSNEEDNLNIDNLYTNLLYISHFEVLISYLDRQRLAYIIKEFNSSNVRNNNNVSSVRKILIKRKEELSSL